MHILYYNFQNLFLHSANIYTYYNNKKKTDFFHFGQFFYFVHTKKSVMLNLS